MRILDDDGISVSRHGTLSHIELSARFHFESVIFGEIEVGQRRETASTDVRFAFEYDRTEFAHNGILDLDGAISANVTGSLNLGQGRVKLIRVPLFSIQLMYS